VHCIYQSKTVRAARNEPQENESGIERDRRPADREVSQASSEFLDSLTQQSLHIMPSAYCRNPYEVIPGSLVAPATFISAKSLSNHNRHSSCRETTSGMASRVVCLVFFIGPTVVGALAFWWFWRRRRAPQSLDIGGMRQPGAKHEDDENLRAS
jgi:hypothetical protein